MVIVISTHKKSSRAGLAHLSQLDFIGSVFSAFIILWCRSASCERMTRGIMRFDNALHN
jgi:hypothetical protein